MACQDTSALEISALMPSPIPRQKCWLGGVGVCCKGTIWQSSMQLESQCAFFISLASTLARRCNVTVSEGRKELVTVQRGWWTDEWKTFDCSFFFSFFSFFLLSRENSFANTSSVIFTLAKRHSMRFRLSVAGPSGIGSKQKRRRIFINYTIFWLAKVNFYSSAWC